MQRKQALLLAARATAVALLLGTANQASAGNYYQTLSVSGMTYAIEDLDTADGVTSTYFIREKRQQVSVRSDLPGHTAHSLLAVGTMRNKPLNTAFNIPDVNAAAANNGTGDATVSAGLTLDMMDYPSWGGVATESRFSQTIMLSPHSAITVTATVDHSWFYDGTLGPQIPGEISPHLIMYAGLSFGFDNATNYDFLTLTDTSGSKTTTATFRFENPYDQEYGVGLTTVASAGMYRLDYLTDNVTTPVLQAVPEPGAAGMVLAGLPLILFAAGRRRNSVKRTGSV